MLAAFITAIATWSQKKDRNEQKWFEQASNFSGWIVVESNPEKELFEVKLRLINASRLPVFGVLIQPVALEHDEGLLELAEPTEGIITIPLEFATDRALDLIKKETHESLKELDPDEHFMAAPAAYDFVKAILLKQGVVISFRDSQNRAWLRRADGILESGKNKRGEFVGDRKLIRHSVEWPE